MKSRVSGPFLAMSALVLGAFVDGGFIPKVSERIDRFFFDGAARASSSSADVPLQSTLVAFDNVALQELGYPITRERQAQLVGALDLSGKILAYDFIFGKSADEKGTRALAEALKAAPTVILGASVLDDLEIDGPEPPIFNSRSVRAVTDAYLDDDGFARWYPLFRPTKEGWLPSFALAMLLARTQETAAPVDVRDGQFDFIELKSASGAIRRLDVRVDPKRVGRLPLVPRAPSAGVHSVSWSDVIAGDAAVNSTVVIASTAEGLRSEIPTSVDPLQIGVHSHIFMYEALSSGTFMRSLPYAAVFWIAWVFLAFVILGPRRSPAYARTVASFIGCSILIIASYAFFWRSNILWSPAGAVVALGLAHVFALSRRAFSSEQRHRVLVKSFSAYLHPSIVSRLAEEGESLRLGGERRELTLFFTDLRNFTALSERVSPEQLVEIMNEYFDLMTRHVQARGGTIDKFIGDAVMAFWNAPLPQPDHRERALAAAADALREFATFSRKWSAEFDLPEPLSLGIGVHSGTAIVGNIGGENRFNYTALGDDVNTASRIEGLCKAYGVELLASESTIGKNHSGDWIEIDVVQVKGRAKAVRLSCKVADADDWRGNWERGREAWTRGDFGAAKAAFAQVPADFGPRSLYLKRLDAFPVAPPDWDGVWKFTEK